jgi:GxxExxY protein
MMEQKNIRKQPGLLFPEESYAIVGAAFEVHSVLGSGFYEAVYQEALELELLARGIPFEAMKRLPVLYKGQPLQKEFVVDFMCFDKIIVEIKAMERLTTRECAQVLNYLKAADKQLGLLLNFGHANGLEKQRVVR